ncbi:hypothetical protein [Nioella nitratireducens]|uniref:hypothetical protein n=1 Tax=Nioella nitratireducens TaxID=1287720 RepID=UPI0008FD80D7|nr:hypothetical protein [Nioella nitratireducens]
MAKDNRIRKKTSDPKRRKSVAAYRASHRRHSATSADRKREAGMTRISVWVPAWAADIVKGFAKRLCEGRVQAEGGRMTAIGVTPTRRRKTRKNQPCDDRQMDLFGPG